MAAAGGVAGATSWEFQINDRWFDASHNGKRPQCAINSSNSRIIYIWKTGMVGKRMRKGGGEIAAVPISGGTATQKQLLMGCMHEARRNYQEES